MRKYFKKLISYSVYRKTLLAYSISILVITILILTSLYGVFIVSIKQNSIDSTQQLLAQLVREVDNLKTNVDNVMSVVLSDSKTLKYVQNIDESKIDNYYLFLKLQEIKSVYTYIENITVINFNKDRCIQAIGNDNDSENIVFASSMLEQQKYIDVRVLHQLQREKNVVSFLQYQSYNNAAVIVDVNADWFQYSINENHQEARNVFIIDVDGSAVTSNTRMVVDGKSISEYFYKMITKQKSQNTSFVYDDEENRKLVFFSVSPDFNWWFIDVQDYFYFNRKFRKISVTFIGIALALVFMCALISFVFNRKIRKPLSHLVGKCKNMIGMEEVNEIDELKYLDIAIARGKHEKYLKENYIKTLYFQNLMTGEQMPLFIPRKELDVLKEQNIANFYCVMLIKIQSLEPLEETVKEEEFKVFRYAICNLSDEIFENDFNCRAVDMGEELVGLLFLLEKKTIDDEYMLCFKQLKKYVEKMFRITVNGSVGIVVDNQKDIFVSYQKARQYLEMNQLISREELIDSNNQVSINYLEKNKKLVESIIEYTEYNFNNPDLSLKSISQIFGLSTTYLGKIFRSIQGEAYSSYVTNYRLEKSKLVLLQTTKTIYEIANEIGFTNSAYYATLFKNTYGMTPTTFRNRQVI